LGGTARRIYRTLDGLDVRAYLQDVVRNVHRNPRVHVCTEAAILEAAGYVGNFRTRVRTGGRDLEIRHGATVIAVGADEYRPTEYLYGRDERVLTQLDLEERLARDDASLADVRAVVMIQCVGCRQEDRNYCSRICCGQAVKNALALKRRDPGISVRVLFRDMRTYGFREDDYREAAERHVQFVRYEPGDAPAVEAVVEEGRPVLRVTVPDPILGRRLALDADRLVLSAAVVPAAGSQEIARLFKVTTGPDGFFQEAHVKLRPVDFAADGIFLCGTAHYPKHIAEAVSQAYGAAGRAVTLLSQDTITASGSVCKVREEDCVSCGACIAACTYGAIEFHDTPRGRKARVNAVLCKGDGLCNAKCPTGAISLQHYTDEEILGQIDASAGDS
jgi:heterodisulfide reductase subunit A